MTSFGRSEQRDRAPARQRSTSAAAAASGGNKKKSDVPAPRGRGAAGPGRPDVGAPPARGAAPRAGGSTLQQLASRVQQRESAVGAFQDAHGGRNNNRNGQHAEESYGAEPDYGALAAAMAKVPRHMQSSLSELLGGHPQNAGQQQQQAAGWAALAAQQAPAMPLAACSGSNRPRQAQGEDEQWSPQRQAPAGEHHQHPADAEAPPSDFTRRNMGRLGGDQMASIFGGGSDQLRASTNKGGAGTFMSALSDLKAGLSDRQRAKQAVQRDQLKRDLEEQMRQKKELVARNKARLAEEDEREEAKLRAYWAQQAQADDVAAAARQQKANPQQQVQQQDGGSRGARQGERAAAGAAGTPGAGRGRADPLAGAAGSSRRGEALVQPGIAVFLPPDKEAERRGALRARQATESYSDDAEDARQLGGGSGQQQQAPAWQHQQRQRQDQKQGNQAAGGNHMGGYPPPTAAPPGLLAQQQALSIISPAQMAAILAAANPAAAAGMHYPYPYPPMQFMPPPATAAPAAAAAGDPQVLALLRELQQEQHRMREQFGQQMEAVSRLSGDASAARSERDQARHDLERVQRMLAERQGSMGGGAAGMPPQQHYGSQQLYAGRRGSDDAELMAVTSHVLPLGMRQIPSRLGTPASSARGQLPGRQQPAFRAAEQEQLLLPARYRQQTVEPWQDRQPQRGSGPAAASEQPAAGAGRQGRAGAAGVTNKAKPAGPGDRGSKAPVAKGWKK